MRKGGSKAKGNEFEIKVCRLISEFWSKGVYKDLCWRAASSGARGTVTRTKVAGYYGDLVSTSPLIEPLFNTFCFELKHYKVVDIVEVLRPCKSTVMTFWRQCYKSALQASRQPILIYKANNRPELMVLPMNMALAFKPAMRKIPKMMAIGSRLAVLNFTEVLENMDLDKFRTILGDLK